jgi:hypothetical protein
VQARQSLPDSDCESDGQAKGEAGSMEQRSTKMFEIDLQACEEQEESKSDEGEHGDWFIDISQTQQMRADNDAEEELQDDRREAQPSDRTEQGGKQRNCCDDRSGRQ